MLDLEIKIKVSSYPQSLIRKQRELSCTSSEGVDEVQVCVQEACRILQLWIVADVVIQHRHRGHGKHLPVGRMQQGLSTGTAAWCAASQMLPVRRTTPSCTVGILPITWFWHKKNPVAATVDRSSKCWIYLK